MCDVCDALVSNRPYRRAFEAAPALAILIGERGAAFDPELVQAVGLS